jgi:ankyrin repeat protein
MRSWYAAFRNQCVPAALVAFVLTSGNQLSQMGYTALMLAATGDDTATVQALIGAGADLNQGDTVG